MVMDVTHPRIPRMVDLMKLGASFVHERMSAENSNNGIAKGMATEAMAVCSECVSSVSGINPVSPNAHPMT